MRKLKSVFIIGVVLLTLTISSVPGSPGNSKYAAQAAEPPPQGGPQTPSQIALAKAISQRRAEGLPVPSVVYGFQSSNGRDFEALAQAQALGADTVTVTGTTTIYFDGPEQAGYEAWPALSFEGSLHTGEEGSLSSGDYTDAYYAAMEAEFPGFWDQVEFGQEARRYTITETYSLGGTDTSAGLAPQIQAATAGEQILMGFTYTGPQLDDAFIEESLEACIPFTDICATVFSIKAGFKLDWALGLRLPAEVALTGPDQMVQGNSYDFTTSLNPLDWSASQYSNTGVAPEDGNEFVLRLDFFVGVKVEVATVDVCNALGLVCSLEFSQNKSTSFTTPFGSGSSFPIPSATIPVFQLGPDEFNFSASLEIDPNIGSGSITADWGAVPGSDCIGSGSLTYTEPNVPVTFGPITACNQGPTNEAQVQLSNFEYHFSQFEVALKAVLDFNFFDFGHWHEEPTLVSFDLSPITGGLFVGDHVQCDFDFDCSEVGPDNTVVVSIPVVDQTPPTTTLVPAGTPGNNNWWVSDVQVTLNAVDGPVVGPLQCGSGVALTEYSFDGINWITYTGPFMLTQEGITTVYYRSTDNEGNVEPTQSAVIMIDKTPPVITGAPTTPPNAYGWWNTDVVVHFEASDAVSGLAFVTPDVTVSTEGANQQVVGTAIDVAGNMAQYTVTDINIDKTPPDLTITSPLPQTYANTDTFNVQWTASDALSGIATETGDLDGTPVTNNQLIVLLLLGAGEHTVTVEVVDKADNVTVASVTFFVTTDIDGLIAAVEYMCQLGLIDNQGICNSLLQKLNHAKDKMGDGQCHVAENMLNAFIHEVDAQSGNHITPEAHDVLVADASYVIANLSVTCTESAAAASPPQPDNAGQTGSGDVGTGEVPPPPDNPPGDSGPGQGSGNGDGQGNGNGNGKGQGDTHGQGHSG